MLTDESEVRLDAALISDSLRTEVQRFLTALTKKESEVISLYFGLNEGSAMSLNEIGSVFNLSPERVRQ